MFFMNMEEHGGAWRSMEEHGGAWREPAIAAEITIFDFL
jgi:hypothetical protein